MKTILITPNVVYSKRKGFQFYLDKNWFDYSRKIKFKLKIYDYDNTKINLKIKNVAGVVFSGGNDLSFFNKNKANLFRDRQEKKLLTSCLKKKVPIIGVCRGFQLISKFYRGEIIKVKNHVKKNHLIELKKNKLINHKKLNVNSFHNFGVINLPKNFDIIGKHFDGSIELARIKNKKVLCFMFHPERKNNSQLLINRIISKFLKIK